MKITCTLCGLVFTPENTHADMIAELRACGDLTPLDDCNYYCDPCNEIMMTMEDIISQLYENGGYQWAKTADPKAHIDDMRGETDNS